MSDVEPAAVRGEPYRPRTEKWTPGAGWARLQREHPEIIPEITEEDERLAEEILAAGEEADRRHQDRGEA